MALDRKYWLKPWDIQAWLTSPTRRRLSLGAIGLFHELTDHQWIEGLIPDDLDELCVIVGKPRSVVEPLWEEVKSEFQKRGKQGRACKKLEIRRRNADRKHDEDAKNGKKGGEKRAKVSKTLPRSPIDSTTSEARLENANERGVGVGLSSINNKQGKMNMNDQARLDPPPTPSLIEPEAPDLSVLWEKIRETYPKKSGLGQAQITWQVYLSREDDAEAFAGAVLAAAKIAAEIYKLDPNGRKSTYLPNFASFLDGGYREDRSGVLRDLQDSSGGEVTVEAYEEYQRNVGAG